MVASRFLRVAALLVFASVPLAAQENHYMVFFTDKNNISQTLSKPIGFLSEKAIQRRLDQGIEITAEDLPIQQTYVNAVKQAGAKTYHTTRWLNGVLITCEPPVLPAIEALGFVDRVEYVSPPSKGSSGGRRSTQMRRNSRYTGQETENQLKMLGIDRMHQANYRGEGITIAVLDSGFPGVDVVPAFQHLFENSRIDLTVSYDFVHHASDVFQHDDHGTEVLSVIAAHVPDAFTGGAPEATFMLFVTEDVPSEYRIEEYNWLFAAEKADSAGADIIHSSLGYYDFDDASMNYSVAQMDGKTAVVTRAAQLAADRGIVVVTSAGNEGNIPTWKIITAPADGEDVVAIGAVNATQQKVSSSSIGPAADGRIKPDLAALGASVRVIKAGGQISTSTGTSLAAPLVTSLVAGVLQCYPDLDSKQVVEVIRKSASQANNPDNMVGFGVPNFQAVVNFQRRAEQTEPFAVYPNPIRRDRDTLTVRPIDPDTFDSCEIQLVSSQGQVLIAEKVAFSWLNHTYNTSLSGLAPGIYYIRVIAGKRKYTFRVVKLR